MQSAFINMSLTVHTFFFPSIVFHTMPHHTTPHHTTPHHTTPHHTTPHHTTPHHTTPHHTTPHHTTPHHTTPHHTTPHHTTPHHTTPHQIVPRFYNVWLSMIASFNGHIISNSGMSMNITNLRHFHSNLHINGFMPKTLKGARVASFGLLIQRFRSLRKCKTNTVQSVMHGLLSKGLLTGYFGFSRIRSNLSQW